MFNKWFSVNKNKKPGIVVFANFHDKYFHLADFKLSA